MAGKIHLVRNDTRPQLVFSVADDTTKGPVDLSTATIRFKFRAAGDTLTKAVMVGAALPGIVLDDGTVDFTPPYNVPGVGGRCYVNWSPTALDTAGDYEAELEITFADATIQTVYDLFKFTVREDFA